MENIRSVPFSKEAENYVLGSILIDNNAMNLVVGKLNATDFYDQDNQILYQAMLILFKENTSIELVTLVDAIKRTTKIPSVEPRKLIISLIDSVPSVVPLPAYLDIVSEKAVERELLNQMRDISDDILTGKKGFNEIIDQTEEKIQGIIKKRRTSKFLTIEKAAQKVFENIEKYTSDRSTITGLDTGFSQLNRTTLGFQKGELIILASRPSVGKSAFALNLAMNATKKSDNHVAFFSLEMSIEQLMTRLFSFQSHIPMTDLRRGNLSPRQIIILGHARQELASRNIYFDESNASDIFDIRSKCRDLKAQDKLDLIIIDYLQLVSAQTSHGKNRQEEVATISRNLKILAKELEVPIVALSQLSRLVDVREDKRPVLSDLRESGSIEQDADIVMFLYRPDDARKRRGRKGDEDDIVYDVVEASKIEDEVLEREIELIISKNRQGSLRDIKFAFFPSESRFEETKYTIAPIKREAKQNE